MRILALVTLPTLGAGNRLRIEQYAGPLRAEGMRLDVSPFFDEGTYRILYRDGYTVRKIVGVIHGIGRRIRDLVRVFNYDLVIVYRESAPLGPPLFERWLGLLNRPYVFDFDDAIFLSPVHPANRRWSWLRPSSRVQESARRARAVIASNEYLAEWARQHSRDVTVIPTAVDTALFRPQAQTFRDPLVIGWTGSSTTAPYLRLLDAPLADLARRRRFVLRIIGADYEHSSATVETRTYRIEEEPAEVAGFDIGLLPQPDDAWTKGKGAFKALLYMACGVPVIASGVGVNEEVIGDGVAGFCVGSPAEWVDALDRLADDPELRAQMGRAGRSRVEKRYALRLQVTRLASVLRRCAEA